MDIGGCRARFTVTVKLLCLLGLLLLAYRCDRAKGLVNTANKICQGTSNRLAQSGDTETRYNNFRLRYTNCTYVEGNLELTYLDEKDDYDLGFLSNIEEVTGYVLITVVHATVIPLTSLRLIRGYTTFLDPHGKDFSLYVAANVKPTNQYGVGLKELQLSSLSEIIVGNVVFHDNYRLCFIDKINWSDILPSSATYATTFSAPGSPTASTCGACDKACTDKQLPCWGSGPSMCQKLTKVTCSPQCDDRCYGLDPSTCCHKECAVGCTGPTNADCLACRNVNRKGRCEQFCPPELIYSPKEFKPIPNPDFMYSYGSLCVDKCPEYLLTDGQHCVQECSAGKAANNEDKKCVDCVGTCPKQCEVTEYISSLNIRNLTGCTVVKGHIKILQITFGRDEVHGTTPLTMEHLSALESVVEVSDYVQIEANTTAFTHLRFLRNLQFIRGRMLLGSVALQIFDTKLQSVDLEGLKQISNGNILVVRNPRLCYVQSVNWQRLITNPSLQLVKVRDNSDEAECAKRKMVCSPECSADGCWGPRDDQCLMCKNFRLGARCLSSCAVEPRIYQHGTSECLPCHAECANHCNDSSASSCDECLHVRDGPYCIPACPATKYADENAVCQLCHEHCEDGCTGPGNAVGPGACNSCATAVFEENGEDVFQCLPGDAPCPDLYYKAKIVKDGPLKGKHSCKRCYHECARCDQFGPSYCLSCLRYKEIDPCETPHCVPSWRCVSHCSAGRYLLPPPPHLANGTAQCMPCDFHCHGGCRGPSASDCDQCKQYTLYTDFDNRETDKTFNCTEKCPDWAPYIQPLGTEGAETITACVINDPNLKMKVLIIVGSVIGGILGIGTIIVVIIICLSRRAKSEEERTRVAAIIRGVDESLVLLQPMKPSTTHPDLAWLRLIKESELRTGALLGTGAFGTVHKGFWYPPNEHIRIPVAIKILTDSTSAQHNVELLEEARIMASVQHDHCLRILAFCMGKQMMLITPLLPEGCLLDYIRKNRQCIGSKVMLNWGVQIAEGMKYLEERKIVHRDLAARNVLVQRPDFVKITDFGLSKLLDHNESSVRVDYGKVPIKWLALESIQHRIYTSKSDVWSYGVTLWEIFTLGKKPHEGIETRSIPELLEKGERLCQPEICTIDVYMLMIKCWVLDADSRPSFKYLADEFKKMARDPGRYLVVAGDDLMRLPSHRDDHAMLLRSLSQPVGADDEPIVSADDYLQPRSNLAGGGDIDEEMGEEETALHNPPGSPWDRLPPENSGTSDKSSVWEAEDAATAQAERTRSAARRRDRLLRHPGSTGSSGSAAAAGGGGAVSATPRDKHKNSRYTSDPCRNALEQQLSSDRGSSQGSIGSRGAEPRTQRRTDVHGRAPAARSSLGRNGSDSDGYMNGVEGVGTRERGWGVGNRGGDARGWDSNAASEDYLQPVQGEGPSQYMQVMDSPDDPNRTASEYIPMSPNQVSFQNPEYFEDVGGQGIDCYPNSGQPINGWQRPPVNGINGENAKNSQHHQRHDSTGSNEYYNDVPQEVNSTLSNVIRN